jgi:hypothetical protein
MIKALQFWGYWPALNAAASARAGTAKLDQASSGEMKSGEGQMTEVWAIAAALGSTGKRGGGNTINNRLYANVQRKWNINQ